MQLLFGALYHQPLSKQLQYERRVNRSVQRFLMSIVHTKSYNNIIRMKLKDIRLLRNTQECLFDDAFAKCLYFSMSNYFSWLHAYAVFFNFVRSKYFHQHLELIGIPSFIKPTMYRYNIIDILITNWAIPTEICMYKQYVCIYKNMYACTNNMYAYTNNKVLSSKLA